MHFSTSTIATLGFASVAMAHMKLNTPVPFDKANLQNGPLEADGSNFPCKTTNFNDASALAANTMPLGSTQKLSFIGSAVHGGGSCQVSITYDKAPTKNSVWKVIHSIEGGCPAKGQTGNLPENANGLAPDSYDYTIPTTLPTGQATLAWTWFNKIGNREMYMNCAPITLTGGSAKRAEEEEELLARNETLLFERDQSAYNALPDMFVANIGNGCGTKEGTDVVFPNPGDSVAKYGTQTSSALGPPTGSCQAANAAPPASTAAAAVPTSAAAAPPASSPTLPGGVFITMPVSSVPPATTTAAAAPATTLTTLFASIPVATSSAVAVLPPATTAAASPPPPATGTGSAFAAGAPCTTEGEWNCIGGTSFQQCGSGTWSVVQQLAAGTECTPGTSSAINIVAKPVGKRGVRFSHEHVARHARHAS